MSPWISSLAVCLLLAGAPTGSEWAARSGDAMATRIDVVLPAAHVAHADEVFTAFRDVETTMNEWRPGSPLAVINAAAGKDAVTAPPGLRALLRRGLELGSLTDGAFDVTWAALWGVWDFRAATPTVPVRAELARRVALIDYRRVELDDGAGTVRLPTKGMVLGLGGVAKGWALDRAAGALREAGVRDFTISAGGQVYAGGQRGDRPWRVGIRDPRGPADDWFAVVEASDVSVSTSGDYERFFMHEGTRYHHILDPRTGRPARRLRSATVVSADATLADALSTALMVMGGDAALDLVAGLPGVDCVLVTADGDVRISAGLGDRLKLRHPPRR